ncbi:MAG: DUF541 domain-containing protein [Actinobacteria bacterium]|uniref:Unannotated protein n=1 Tax=freshwater metagenome TaxID=449393 RepID=A0A6J6LSE5_9ZZZZ|nr:SIMPL domain-containing protein [Actinomycetota bacterium]MSW48083.1 DUF541 domain-containing protein [Actinomycetota bacterium]MSX24327.1 DUF541 domain-containing protein [Actinomycetota bacterium]MSY46554.1 DUF541 domain-containing protein [Actinomycetota bacterium]MSY57501.1 DUF541 domain-containing protein [Actinomycetota bacterium]
MNRNRIKSIAVVALALSLVGGIASAPASLAATPSRHITISAEGTVKVVPDAVRFNATVSIVAGTNKDALAQTSTAAAAVRAALLANKISAKDIATQSLTVYPEYNYTQDKGTLLVGYRGSQSFAVVIRSATNAGPVVDAVVAAGGDSLQVNGVTPFVLDASKSAASARLVAVKNAKAKALSYAALLGVKLNSVTYLVENYAPASYAPSMSMAKNDAGSTVIDLGQQDVTVSVTIRWSLR